MSKIYKGELHMEIAIRLTLPQIESLMTSLEAYQALLYYLSRESKSEDWIKIDNSTHSWAPIVPTSRIQQKKFFKASEDVFETFSKYPKSIPLTVLCTELFTDIYRTKAGQAFINPFQSDWIQQIGAVVELFENAGFDTSKYIYDPKKYLDFENIFNKLTDIFLWDEFDNFKAHTSEYCGGCFYLSYEPWWIGCIDSVENPGESIYIMKASISITEDELQALSSALNMLLHLWQGEWGSFEQFYQNMYMKKDLEAGKSLSEKDSLLYEYRKVFGYQYVFEETRNDILRVFDSLPLKQFNIFSRVDENHFMRQVLDVKMFYDVLMHQRYEWYSIDQKENIDYPKVEFSQEFVGGFDGDTTKWLDILNEHVLKKEHFSVINKEGLLCVPIESETYQIGYKALARGDILYRKKNGFYAVYHMIPPLGKFL